MIAYNRGVKGNHSPINIMTLTTSFIPLVGNRWMLQKDVQARVIAAVRALDDADAWYQGGTSNQHGLVIEHPADRSPKQYLDAAMSAVKAPTTVRYAKL